MYFEPTAEDVAGQHEMYTQAVYDVVSARYPCGERDCLALAALQTQVEYNDMGLDQPTLQQPTKLARFLPLKYAESPSAPGLAAEIRRLHAAYRGKTREAAEAEYLSYVKEWQVYGSSFFFVEPQMNADLPEEVFLAVNPKGILIIDPDSKEVLHTHPFSEVPTWGHSGTSFVLHVGNLLKQTKLYFSTEQGKEINDLGAWWWGRGGGVSLCCLLSARPVQPPFPPPLPSPGVRERARVPSVRGRRAIWRHPPRITIPV